MTILRVLLLFLSTHHTHTPHTCCHTGSLLHPVEVCHQEHLRRQGHLASTRHTTMLRTGDSRQPPGTECLLHCPLQISCYSQEVRGLRSEEDRLAQVQPRLRNICSCLHAGGSDSSLRWSSMEHREDSHSPCYRSQNLVLHPPSRPLYSLAQTRLARSPPGPTPGPAREVRGQFVIKAIFT